MPLAFSALFPALPVEVGGERLRLRPVVLSELADVDRVLEGWRMLVATGGEWLDPEALETFRDLLAASVGKGRAWLDGQAPEQFDRLVSLVLAINEDIWKPSAKAASDAPLDWPEIVQRLVEHGHTLENIQQFTIVQARAFLLECLKTEREDMAMRIQASAFSMADGKSVAKAVKELTRVQ